MTQTCARCGLFHPQNVPCVSQALSLVESPGRAGGRLTAGRPLPHLAYAASRRHERRLPGRGFLARKPPGGIKELRVPAASSAEERQEAEAWFAREAYILSILNHPLVPEFYSSFPEGGTSYIVQEYADGENLNELVRTHGAVFRGSRSRLGHFALRPPQPSAWARRARAVPRSEARQHRAA